MRTPIILSYSHAHYNSFSLALLHRADDGLLAGNALPDDFAEHIRHAAVVLGAVAVAGIDHDRGAEFGGFEGVAGFEDVVRAVVRAVFATAQNEVAIGIAVGRHGAGDAILADAEKGLRLHRGLDGIDRGLDVAKGAVLETERHREARGHLAVRL